MRAPDVESQIAELESALMLADKRLRPFEQKYGVTSDYFIAEMTAEDLTGGDDEYIHWVGEYQLRRKLQEKLNALDGRPVRAVDGAIGAYQRGTQLQPR